MKDFQGAEEKKIQYIIRFTYISLGISLMAKNWIQVSLSRQTLDSLGIDARIQMFEDREFKVRYLLR